MDAGYTNRKEKEINKLLLMEFNSRSLIEQFWNIKFNDFVSISLYSEKFRGKKTEIIELNNSFFPLQIFNCVNLSQINIFF